MADFSIAFDYMISNEDYAPTDPRYGRVETDNDGGKVRFGVNSNALGKNLVSTGFYSLPTNIAYKVAQNLYNTNVWQPMHGDDINSQQVASKILDMCVNMGLVEAAKLAQRAAGVNVDGVIGPLTLKAINTLDEQTMITNLIFWWNWFIEQELNNKPQDADYKEAWTARADKLPPVA